MPNEKMTILKMLEEGKITSSEASRLLEAAGATTGASYEKKDYSGYSGAANNGPGPTRSGESASSGFDDFVSDLSKKFESIAKDMEPKLQKFTETVVEKTVNVADKISKTLYTEAEKHSSTSSPAASAGYTPPSGRQGIVKDFEMTISPGYNELSLSGLNADVLIKGYNGDKITAKIVYKPKKGGAGIEIMKLGNKYFMNYDEDAFDFVGIDAFIPEKYFNAVSISNVNGKLDISTISAENISLFNSNGKTDVKNIKADSIKIESNNGLLALSGICARQGNIENFNGPIEAYALDICGLKMTGFNGGIGLTMSSFDNYPEYVWSVEASNGRMTLNIPSMPGLGYYVKAHSSFGSIKLGLTGLNYIASDNSYTEAKSVNYDGSSKKVRLSLETSNGPLVVN